jgi:hypothetical protein
MCKRSGAYPSHTKWGRVDRREAARRVGPFPETNPTRPLGFANRPPSPAEFILGRAKGATRGHGRDRRLTIHLTIFYDFRR